MGGLSFFPGNTYKVYLISQNFDVDFFCDCFSGLGSIRPSAFLEHISADVLCISCTIHFVCSAFLVLVKAKKGPLLGQLVFVLEVLLHLRKILHFTSEAAEHDQMFIFAPSTSLL